MKLTNPTRSSHKRTSPALKFLIGSAVLVLSSCLTVCAQTSDEVTPPKVEAKLIVGGASFAEPAIPHSIVGGAVRVYLTLMDEFVGNERGKPGRAGVFWASRLGTVLDSLVHGGV